MKVLIVTDNHYPYEGTCSNIIDTLLGDGQIWRDNNIDVDVLAIKKSYFEDDEETYNRIHIFRVFSWTLIDRKAAIRDIAKTKWRIPRVLIERGLLHYKNRLFKGSYLNRLSYLAFIRKLNHIHAERYDVIISISGNYEHSIAARDFVKKRNQRFVLYQVDPLGSNQIYDIQSQKRRKADELSMYKQASVIITTPIIIKEHGREKDYSRLKGKMIGMEFPVVKPRAEPAKKEKTKKICMFAGSIYGGVRNPDYTYKLFEHIIGDDIEFHMVGVSNEQLPPKYRCAGIICHGRKNIDECNKLMKDADILVNIGNKVLNQVPSKIFDYISMGKPIVNICKSRKCPSLDYLAIYPEALNLFEEEEIFEEQVELLRKFIKAYHPAISSDKIGKMYEKCTPEYCRKELIHSLGHLSVR